MKTPTKTGRHQTPTAEFRLKDYIVDGSSPRVRGTELLRYAATITGRFIPACAGNSHRQARSGPDAPVHPRVCGEQLTFRRRHSAGSSPRVRGTFVRVRFIPACAGNSFFIARLRGCFSVHPRVCGEQNRARSASYGSSPRVRGTERMRSRFIPACAGNREQRTQKAIAVFGSSPRVRGTVRFIPACAGNTWQSIVPDAVHPRVCGEQVERPVPRDAGKKPMWFLAGCVRFIPACAGNSIPPGSSPRVRGTESDSVGSSPRDRADGILSIGSSPRVRGTVFSRYQGSGLR